MVNAKLLEALPLRSDTKVITVTLLFDVVQEVILIIKKDKK
jgi:hypothetical protein